MKPIRVMIVDDHPLLLDALLSTFDDEEDFEIIAEVANGREATQMALDLKPDVMIVDLYIPDGDGIEVIQSVRDQDPTARILVFTSSTEEIKIVESVQAGAMGYLIKDARRGEILHAISEIYAGRSYFPPQVSEKLANALRHARSDDAQLGKEQLTGKEKAVLELIKEGDSNASIARKLFISETTVRTHVSHILQKLGYTNRNELVLHYLKNKKKSQGSPY